MMYRLNKLSPQGMLGVCGHLLLPQTATEKMSARIYVGNLGDNASKREIEREFEYFGPLRDVWIARNPPGFAFVVFEDRRDAEDATRDLDGKFICGNRVRVEMARGPTRGGRAARLGLTEKCYECGRVGHYARDCTRRPGTMRDRGDRGRRSRSRSRSRSPRRRYRSRSKSRSKSPRRNIKSERRSHSRSRSPSHSKSRSRSRSPIKDTKREDSPRDDRDREEDDRPNHDDENDK